MRLLSKAGWLVACSLALSSPAQAGAETVTFAGAVSNSPLYPGVASVRATLSLPTQANPGSVPAVVLLHGSGGIDGRGAFHAAGLNEAGFATLEVYMFDGGARPREGHGVTLSHAYGALRFLTSHPAIDPKAIGVMGFSWGGNMALRMASAKMRDAFGAALEGHDFAAHVAFYPVCWFHQGLVSATDPAVQGTYAAFTGAPVWLAIGDKDDYGAPQDCPDFAASVADASQGKLTVTVYPGATHGWDVPGGASRTVFDPSANRGKGAQVRMFADQRMATRSRSEAIAFFDTHLRRKP
jgi:uncharacterized protein